jgi:uncharacterized damage-inducible protein DinB
MTHPLVVQLRFTRSELQRALDGVSDADARHRLEPMNCISWMVGHLANQEQYYWVYLAQGKAAVPGLHKLVGYGKPASTPPLADMWAAWHSVTQAADPYLDTLTPEVLQTHLKRDGNPLPENIGTLLQRVIYHYWYHIGEGLAVRQLLGHSDLPEFVGDLGTKGPYRPELR